MDYALLKSKPEPEQKIGIKFLLEKPNGAVLGFATGLGKTYTALCASYFYRTKINKATVVFCPKTAIHVWEKEIKEHTHFTYVKVQELVDVYNSTGELVIDNYDVLIIHYSYLVPEVFPLIKKLCTSRVCIFDEAHKLKNPEAEKSMIANLCTTEALVKWGLTATSMLNSPLDLYGILSFFNPKLFKSVWEFKERFCILKKSKGKGGRTFYQIEGYKNLDELSKIADQYILTMSRNIKVNFLDIPYAVTPQEDDRYITAASGLVGQSDSVKMFATRLPDLQRVVDGSIELDGTIKKPFRTNSKSREFLRAIKKKLDLGESIIVFTEYYYSFDMLEYFLLKYFPNIPLYKISGRPKDDGKDPNMGKSQCIILMTGAGSASLNLQYCNNIFLYSIPFSVGVFCQLVGRIARMNSKHLDNLNVHLMINKTTIDYYKKYLIEINSKIIEQVLGKSDNLPTAPDGVRRKLLIKMRKDLLWRIKNQKKK